MTTVALSHRSRTRLYLFLGVLLSVLITAVVRFPHAGAAELIMREEVTVGGETVVFELSDDDLVGVSIRDQKIRFEEGINAAPEEVTKAQLETLSNEVKTYVKEDYGWDVSSSADRSSIHDEANLLGQALRSIPDSALEGRGVASVPKLREIVDMLTGESECRGRCLPGAQEVFFKVVPLIAIGSAVAAMQAEFFDPSYPKEVIDSLVTVWAVTGSLLAAFIFGALEFAFEIRTQKLQTAVMGALFVALTTIHLYKDDSRILADARSTTPAAAAKEEAEEISELTPAEDDPRDYDMVHDEL